MTPLTLSKEAEKVLAARPWPGNVRELENTLHRAVLLSTGSEIDAEAVMAEGGAADGEDGAPGTTGMLLRSRDSGDTWDTVPLTPEPNSSMWSIAVHEADPNLMYANSVFGYIYRSDDGGENWEKLSRELSEIRTLLWVPN